MSKANEEKLLPQELSTEELEDVTGGFVDVPLNTGDYTTIVPVPSNTVACPYYKSTKPLRAEYCEKGCKFQCVNGCRDKGIPGTLIDREFWNWVINSMR